MEQFSDYYLIRPCKGVVGFVATPKKNIKLDLKDCIKRLLKAGYKVLDAEVMLIAEKDIELTIYESGKLLARTNDETAARHAMDEVYGILTERR